MLLGIEGQVFGVEFHGFSSLKRGWARNSLTVGLHPY